MIPDNSNLKGKGSFGVTVGEFRGCGRKFEVTAHIVPTIRKQRLREACV